KLIIDGKEIDVPAEFTLLQACEAAGAEIPRFCYHERLSIAGNCRMCLVEIKGGPKPVASCAWAVRDCRPGPKGEPPEISTRSPMVKKAREGVMEFLLINHPLDCPICDQGGECDLQDQAMGYGVDTSRFAENKRAVEDKYLGALVKTSMNRCIQCTRCVRFAAEVCGVPEMGATGRGEDMEITTYLESALTSKPYAFAARPWELGKTQSIDVMDGVGSAIRVDTRGREVMRILPRVNEAVNEEWISDKTRHIVDGLRTQRLDRPYIRENGQLRAASWSEAFGAIAAKTARIDGKRIGAIAGDLAAVEEMFALKELLAKCGSVNLAIQGGDGFNPKAGRASYIFNPTIAGIEQADALLIVGSNPRKEAAVLNARIRKRWRSGRLKIGVIGAKADLTYEYDHLGAGTDSLSALAAGKHSFADVLKNAKNPIVLVGAGAAARHDGPAVLALAAKLALDFGAVKDGWNGFGVLQDTASRVGALDIGFTAGAGGLNAAQMTTFGTLDVLFLLGADEIKVPDGTFVVYIGTHGDRGAHRADVILPGAAYTEKSGIYVNTEGRVQMANRASFPPGEAREDWAIIRALSDVLA
ncbi:MAG TPA: NADH-quinone oxidoreductase subunit NuoG, partial [Bradyrhizobium sp.]|nr:NADH-quinone oxidoreductase subunit NuoG [Bradyrhizobium sp.]